MYFLSKTTFTKKNNEEMTRDLTYTYNAPKPHAVSEVGGTSISYDKNGNPIVLESDTLFRYMVWDEENRLTCLTDDSYRSILKKIALILICLILDSYENLLINSIIFFFMFIFMWG